MHPLAHQPRIPHLGRFLTAGQMCQNAGKRRDQGLLALGIYPEHRVIAEGLISDVCRGQARLAQPRQPGDDARPDAHGAVPTGREDLSDPIDEIRALNLRKGRHLSVDDPKPVPADS